MPRRPCDSKYYMLHLVVYPPTCFESFGLRILRKVMEICLEKPESEQGSVDRFFAEIQDELLQRHGLIVNAYYEVA